MLDLTLSGLGGVDAIKRIRMKKPAVPILVTARAEVEDRVQALDHGADDFFAEELVRDELADYLLSPKNQ